MALIFSASTDLLSTQHTSRYLVPFLRWLMPDVSGSTIVQIHFFLRKAAHVTEYAVLTALLFRGWRSLLSARSSVAAALGTALLFAAGDEFHQTFVASRTGAIGDVLIDGSGAILGVAVCWICGLWQRRSGDANGIPHA